ncbi:MAG: ATP-binding protein [Acidobacteriota bacterium]|nr:ATP-binding protein [Acidobacteriota bacterium]
MNDLKTKHILFMGEDKHFATRLAAAARERGWGCEVTTNWEDTLLIARKKETHALFVDWSTPGLEQVPFVDTLAYLPKQTVVVFPQEDAHLAGKAIAGGALDYLVKDEHLNYLKVLPWLLDCLFDPAEGPHEVRLPDFDRHGRMLLEWSPAATVVLFKGRIVYLNRAGQRLTGYEVESVFSQPGSILFPRDYGAHFRIEVARLEESHPGRVVQFETNLVHANGSELHCEVCGSSLSMEGDPYLVLVLHDRTQQHTSQLELADTNLELKRLIKDRMAQVEDLRQTLGDMERRAHKTEMATSVLHNVKNVLTSLVVGTNIIGRLVEDTKIDKVSQVARLLSENKDNLNHYLAQDSQGRMIPQFLEGISGLLRRDQEKLAHEVDRLVRNIEHINASIQTQLNASRLVADTVTASELFDEALEINRRQLDLFKVEVDREITGKPRFQANRNKVMQILVNLIANAAQALQKKEGARHIKLVCHCGDGRLIFQVTDNGVGMSRETLANLFRFGFTTKKDGHGFGLHGCRRMAREMSGDLSAASEGLGTGAVFTLNLPCSNLS